LRKGEPISARAIKVELRAKLPRDFDPSSIDSRILQHEDQITLLGIGLLDPDSELVKHADVVILSIHELLVSNHAVKSITASYISDNTKLPEVDVAIIFKKLADIGIFHNSGTNYGHGVDGWLTVTIDERAFDAYLKYESIEQVLETINDDESFTAKTTDYSKDNIVEDPRVIFVVHGRNLEARNSLFRFLRSIGLKPLEWSQAIKETGKASPFIGEILDVAFSKAQAVVVLMTPDDVAQLREPFRSPHDAPYESQLTGQARPNVLFEAGMAMGRYPDRTIILELGMLRPFSDIAGRHTIRLSNDSAARHELAQRLETAGCPVDITGRDWHTDGDFNIESVSLAQREASQSTTQTLLDESEKVEYFNHLTSREKEILRFYIERKTRSTRLRYDEGAVVSLIQADVLYYASNRAATIWNPGEYYTDINMNLWAWKYLNEHPELIQEATKT
jgi:predicted nucleotide-binding protein